MKPWVYRWKYRFLAWFVDRPDGLARSSKVESELWRYVQQNKRPTVEQCRKWALELGIKKVD